MKKLQYLYKNQQKCELSREWRGMVTFQTFSFFMQFSWYNQQRKNPMFYKQQSRLSKTPSYIESKDKLLRVYNVQNPKNKTMVQRVLQKIQAMSLNYQNRLEKIQWQDCDTITILSELKGFKKYYYKKTIQMQKRPFLKELVSVGLPNIKIIQIRYVDIGSLEALSFLNCPDVEKLFIQKTNSSNLKPFQKLNFPRLKSLFVIQKVTYNLEYFSRAKFSNKFQDLDIVYLKPFHQSNHLNTEGWNAHDLLSSVKANMSFLFKIKSEQEQFSETQISFILSAFERYYKNNVFQDELMIEHSEMPLLRVWIKSVSRFYRKKEPAFMQGINFLEAERERRLINSKIQTQEI